MTSCPTNEQLLGLLAEVLSMAERDTTARHIDGCAACQERLAGLTRTPDTEVWRRAVQPHQGTSTEQKLLRRLKRMPSRLTPSVLGLVVRPTGFMSHAGTRTKLATSSETTGRAWLRNPGGIGTGRDGRCLQGLATRPPAHCGVEDDTDRYPSRYEGPGPLFSAEAAVIARLQHPNIVQIYDVGEAASRPYFVLEYVAGGSLAQHLQGTPQPVRSAARMVETPLPRRPRRPCQ